MTAGSEPDLRACTSFRLPGRIAEAMRLGSVDSRKASIAAGEPKASCTRLSCALRGSMPQPIARSVPGMTRRKTRAERHCRGWRPPSPSKGCDARSDDNYRRSPRSGGRQGRSGGRHHRQSGALPAPLEHPFLERLSKNHGKWARAKGFDSFCTVPLPWVLLRSGDHGIPARHRDVVSCGLRAASPNGGVLCILERPGTLRGVQKGRVRVQKRAGSRPDGVRDRHQCGTGERPGGKNG